MSVPLFEVPAQNEPTPILDALNVRLAGLADAGLMDDAAEVAAEVARNIARRMDLTRADHAVAKLSAELAAWCRLLPVPPVADESVTSLGDLLAALPQSA